MNVLFVRVREPDRATRTETVGIHSRRHGGSRLAALLLVFLVAFSALPAAAQEPVTEPVAAPVDGLEATVKVYLPRIFKPRPIVCVCAASALDALPNRAPIPGEYIVTMRDATERAAAAPNGLLEPLASFAQQAVGVLGGSVIEAYDGVDIFSAHLTADAAAQLALNPNVAAVEPNRILRLDDWENRSITPFSAQTEASAADPAPLAAPASFDAVLPWGLDRSDQRNLPLDSRFVPYNSGAKVHVYIIDSGIQWQNPEFHGRLGAWFTAVADGNGSYDCDGHGTHVAGTVGGITYGLARSVVLHAVRVLDACGSASDAEVVAGVDWVTKYAQKPAVANMSLGGEGVSIAINTAVNKSILAGITYVVAAGNDGANACDYSPASAPAAITVGASDMYDFNAAFSNYGACLDIYAPGVDVLSSTPGAKPEVAIAASWDGTSMAAPHVAGAAALYLSSVPNATPATVANVLRNSASTSRLWYLRTTSPNRLMFAANTGTSPAAPARPPAAACTNLIKNGSFEAVSNWSQDSSNGYDLVCLNGSCGTAFKPGKGVGMAWLGGLPNENSFLWQSVTLPAGVPSTLSYWYLNQSSETSCSYDFGYAGAFQGNTTLQMTGHSLCAGSTSELVASNYVWRRGVIDLSAYAGRTVTIEFGAQNDDVNVSSLLLDEVAVYAGWNCVAPTSVTGASAELTADGEVGVTIETATTQPEILKINPLQ